MINVLIVDDDPMVAELNRRYLEQIDGFCWQGSVSTLQAAKQRLQENSPAIDLVLLDIYMQKDNGLDLLPEIRRMHHDVDIIMISSASDMPAIKTALLPFSGGTADLPRRAPDHGKTRGVEPVGAG